MREYTACFPGENEAAHATSIAPRPGHYLLVIPDRQVGATLTPGTGSGWYPGLKVIAGVVLIPSAVINQDREAGFSPEFAGAFEKLASIVPLTCSVIVVSPLLLRHGQPAQPHHAHRNRNRDHEPQIDTTRGRRPTRHTHSC